MFRILHLSDLHIQDKTSWSTAPILSDAIRLIIEQANSENVDVVAFTGDIAYSGKPEQYRLAQEWLAQLCLEPSGLNLDRKAVLFVPGNHDVDRALISPPATAIEDALAKSSHQSDIASHYGDSESRDILMRRLRAYSTFAAEFGGSQDFGSLCWSRVFEHHGRLIRFEGLNSAWLCRGSDDHRRLLIGQPQLSDVMNLAVKCGMTVGMMHHPLADLMEHDENNTRNHVRNNYKILLRGHLHSAEAVRIASGVGDYIEIAAGALHESHEAHNRFSLIDITDDFAAIEVRTFVWQSGRWILDRNLFQTNDGVGRFPLSVPADHSDSRIHSGHLPQPSVAGDASGLPASSLPFAGEDEPDAECKEVLAQFPRFSHRPSQQDSAVRHTLLSEVMTLARSTRDVRIRRDPGSRHIGFLASIVEEFARDHPDAPALLAKCGGVTTGAQLQDTLAVLAGASVPQFGVELRSAGHALLILEDLDPQLSDQHGSHLTIDDTIQALLDFCESLVVLRVTTQPYPEPTKIRIGALDPADTRAYLEALPQFPRLSSPTDYARIHRVTGGLPVHLDALAEALEITTLENALAQIDAEPFSTRDVLPESLKHEIATLQHSSDDDSERIRRLLWTLSILERGETLSVVKRLDNRRPIWPKHANYLQKRACLDIVEASPSHYGANPARQLGPGERILRVPRMVRDFVVSIMTEEERLRLTEDAASLYFGSDWKIGAVRMRRRIAFGNEMSSHQSGNEMTLLRTLAAEAEKHFPEAGSSLLDLGLSYMSQLASKGFYGEAYEAGRELLGIADSHAWSMTDRQNYTLKRLLGTCGRMIGERQSCIDYLSEALPAIRATGETRLICDVLVDLALAINGVNRGDEAAALAQEIIGIAPRESSDWFQAKAILATQEEGSLERLKKLRFLATRSRNLKHYTVADNIALEIASSSDDIEEKLRMLSSVTSRNDREYNYVRATIRRIETLLEARRVSEITEYDVRNLWRSYSLAYTQRLSGIFDWCHRVCWDYLEATGQRERQAELLVFSSFVWRINGNADVELRYMRMLSTNWAAPWDPLNQVCRFFGYCKSRLAALTR